MTITLETLIEHARKRLSRYDTRDDYGKDTAEMAYLIEGVTGIHFHKALDLIFAKPEPELPPMPGGIVQIDSIFNPQLRHIELRESGDENVRPTMQERVSYDAPNTYFDIIISRRALLEALGWTGE